MWYYDKFSKFFSLFNCVLQGLRVVKNVLRWKFRPSLLLKTAISTKIHHSKSGPNATLSPRKNRSYGNYGMCFSGS